MNELIGKDNPDPLFAGVFPCGISYANRHIEVNGDYKRLGFLCFSTLELEVEKDCPPELAERIRRDAATLQARKGETYSVSACGQTALLGERLIRDAEKAERETRIKARQNSAASQNFASPNRTA
jgi:hypothetical protein